MSIDVLIGQAYFLRFDPTLWDAARPYPPLGALYAAASVRHAGYDVRVFDAMLAASTDAWTTALALHRPTVAVIYEDNFNYLSKMCLLRMREAALTMTASAIQRGMIVLVAGSDATDHPETYLQHGATAVIAGEGDVTLVQVLDALRLDASSLETVDGIVFSRDGRAVRTRPREVRRDLDQAPRPAWDLIDIERYRRVWQQRHGYFSMNIATSRGCPFHCNWCAKPIYGQRYMARGPEHVAEEVAWLKATYRPDHLWMTDDIFGLKPGWVQAFASALEAREAVTPFKCLMRADGVTDAAVAALVRAGCRTVWIGAESGSQRVLDAMEKGTRVEQIERTAGLLKQAGIEVGFFLQFGYPGETFADIELTLAMVDRCRPDDIGVSVSYPLPGTPFHDRVRAQLGAKQNWVDSADLAMMYQATFQPEFYRALHRFVHARFRARKGWQTLRRVVTDLGSADRQAAVAVGRGLLDAASIPVHSWRLRQLARRPAAAPPTPRLLPMRSPQAASVPSEQGG